MTQEEKQLLIKDLCARLPYGVKILDVPANVVGDLFLVSTTDTVEYEPEDETNDDTGSQTLYNIKPYLRPMLSMTLVERIELKAITKGVIQIIGLEDVVVTTDKGFDYLNAHHFDYRGLIERGLAIEAPEDMYKTE